jgi:hypothetical protein
VAFDFIDEKGALRILGANAVVKDSLFDNNRVAGLYVSDASGASLENLTLRSHRATYGNSNLNSAGLWIKGALPSLNALQLTNNYYGIFWPTSASCQSLDNNATLSFSQNTVSKSCGQSDPW